MKKLKKLLCLLLAFTIAVSAMSCGRKPSDNDVQTEQNDILTEKSPKPDAENELVEKEPAKEGTFVEEDGTVRQVNTFESEDGWVTFVVNAVVEGYDITELPVVSVVPNHYDSTELKQISEAFAQENTVYGYTEQLTVTELNHVRDEFEGLIEAYKNRTADGAINATDEEIADSIAGWQAYIDAIDADLVNAPEEMPYTEPVYEYGPESRYDEGKSYLRGHYVGKNTFLALYTDDGRIMKITASDVTRNEKASSFGLEGDEIYPYNYNVIFAAVDNKRNGSYGGTYTQKTPFTEEEKQKATEEVLAVVQNMGMGDWKLVAVAEGEPREGEEHFGYSLCFYFYPAFYDVPLVLDALSGWAFSTEENKDVPAFSEGSYMFIAYSNGGILDIGINNDIDIISETEQKQLMSYDEMLKTIYGYVAKKWGFGHIYAISPYQQIKDENYSYNLYINKISLEYIRTVSGDDPDHYDLIPVWVVYGHPNVVNVRIGNAVIEGMSGFDSKAETNMFPLMIINAYDGTLINSTILTN